YFFTLSSEETTSCKRCSTQNRNRSQSSQYACYGVVAGFSVDTAVTQSGGLAVFAIAVALTVLIVLALFTVVFVTWGALTVSLGAFVVTAVAELLRCSLVRLELILLGQLAVAVSGVGDVLLTIFVQEPSDAIVFEGLWPLFAPLDVHGRAVIVGALYAGLGATVVRSFAFTLMFTFALVFAVAIVVFLVDATIPQGGGFLRDRAFRCICWNASECDCAS